MLFHNRFGGGGGAIGVASDNNVHATGHGEDDTIFHSIVYSAGIGVFSLVAGDGHGFSRLQMWELPLQALVIR